MKAALLAKLRRWHGWLGVWGGVAGLLFGVTGIIQNHRAILPLPAKKVERSVIHLPLAAPPANAEALGRKLQEELGFAGRPMRTAVEASTTLDWNGRSIEQPERWQFWFEAPRRYARASTTSRTASCGSSASTPISRPLPRACTRRSA